MAKLVSTAEKIPFKYLIYTKDIRIKAPFHKRLSNRCPYRDHPSLSDEAVLLSLDDDTDDDEVSEEVITIYQISGTVIGETRLSCFGICMGAFRLVRSHLFPCYVL
jgi:hypothetical protein